MMPTGCSMKRPTETQPRGTGYSRLILLAIPRLPFKIPREECVAAERSSRVREGERRYRRGVSGWEARDSSSSRWLGVVLLALAVMALDRRCDGGVTSSFRRQLASSDDMPLSSDVFRVPPGYNAPQQVHITQGDHDGTAMIILWVTENEPGSSKVLYGTSPDDLKFMAKGKHTTYTFFKYTSGYIHHCTIKNLKYDTKYYYAVGIGQTLRKFWFTIPPKVGPDVPYTFGLIDTTGLQYLPLPEYHLNLMVLASLGYEVCKAYTITYRRSWTES